mgnify:CR=1 FL=1
MKNRLENKFWWAARSFAAVLVLGVSVATSQSVVGDWSGEISSFPNLECTGDATLSYDADIAFDEDSLYAEFYATWTPEDICGILGGETEPDGSCGGDITDADLMGMYCGPIGGILNSDSTECDIYQYVVDVYTVTGSEICIDEGDDQDCGPIAFTDDGFYWNFTYPSGYDDGTGSCTFFSFGPADAASGIFISEYAEGTSHNKYLEIYNGTGSEVDLSGFAFPSVSNAPTTVGEYEYWNSFNTGATIGPWDVYVIAHPSADDQILAHADQTHNYLSNGDDGYCLVEGDTSDYTIIDCLGDWNGDPGSGWDVAGVTNGTQNHTLVRQSWVLTGNPDWPSSAGTDHWSSEWLVLDNEDWSNLGSHTTNETQDNYVTYHAQEEY